MEEWASVINNAKNIEIIAILGCGRLLSAFVVG
jgi:hypothetical protein